MAVIYTSVEDVDTGALSGAGVVGVAADSVLSVGDAGEAPDGIGLRGVARKLDNAVLFNVIYLSKDISDCGMSQVLCRLTSGWLRSSSRAASSKDPAKPCMTSL